MNQKEKKIIVEQIGKLSNYYITDDQKDYMENNSGVEFDKEFFNAGKAKESDFTEEDADPDELTLGIETEMEHTTSEKIAKKIALDHLSEIQDYYTRLKAMEEDAINLGNCPNVPLINTMEEDAKSSNEESEGSEDTKEDTKESEDLEDIEISDEEEVKKEEYYNFESLQKNKNLEFVNESKYVNFIHNKLQESKNYKSFVVEVENKQFKSVYGCKDSKPSKNSKFYSILEAETPNIKYLTKGYFENKLFDRFLSIPASTYKFMLQEVLSGKVGNGMKVIQLKKSSNENWDEIYLMLVTYKKGFMSTGNDFIAMFKKDEHCVIATSKDLQPLILNSYKLRGTEQIDPKNNTQEIIDTLLSVAYNGQDVNIPK